MIRTHNFENLSKEYKIKFLLTLEEDPVSQKGWLTVFRLQSYKADRDNSCESRLNAMFVRPDQKKVFVGKFNSIWWSI